MRVRVGMWVTFSIRCSALGILSGRGWSHSSLGQLRTSLRSPYGIQRRSCWFNQSAADGGVTASYSNARGACVYLQ